MEQKVTSLTNQVKILSFIVIIIMCSKLTMISLALYDNGVSMTPQEWAFGELMMMVVLTPSILIITHLAWCFFGFKKTNVS